MRILPAALLLWAMSCTSPFHGPRMSHEHGHEHAADTDRPSLTATRWTPTHELFLDAQVPVAAASFAYHAHVTRLSDHQPATEGSLTLTFEQDGVVVTSHRDDAITSPGIFAGEASAPPEPGTYDLRLEYTTADTRTAWPIGELTIGAEMPVVSLEEPQGEIHFSKEAQWQIPFRVTAAHDGALPPTIAASGVARAAPDATHVVAAPAGGLLLWTVDPPAPGRVVTQGSPLGRLLPAAASTHWARLQAELRTARIDLDLAKANLSRIEALSSGDLVSARRVDEARAELSRAEADLTATRGRLLALSSRDEGAVSIVAPASGMVTDLGAGHGEVVAAGTPLVTVSSNDALVVDARVYDRHADALNPLHSLVATTAHHGAPLDLLALGGTVLSERLIFDPDNLSAPLLVRLPGGSGLRQGDLVQLEVGAGDLVPSVVVPLEAVVEINGQDVLFVQVSGETFSRRKVVLGERNATHVAVLSGVEAGERVVVEGGFDVHFASLGGALESHRH